MRPGGGEANAGQGTAFVEVLGAEGSSTWGLRGLEMLVAFVAIPGYIPPVPQGLGKQSS